MLVGRVLDAALAAGDAGRTLDPLKFQKVVAKLTAGPWALYTGEDLRWPATKGGNGKVKFMHWYLEQVFQLISVNPEVYRRFQEVNHMLKGPEALFHPRSSVPCCVAPCSRSPPRPSRSRRSRGSPLRRRPPRRSQCSGKSSIQDCGLIPRTAESENLSAVFLRRDVVDQVFF